MNERPPSGQAQASDVRQLLRALLVTLVSVATLLGSFLLAQLDIARGPATATQIVAQRATVTPFLPTLTVQGSPTAPLTAGEATVAPTEAATTPPEQTPERAEDATEAPPEVFLPTPTDSQPQAPPQAPPAAPTCTIPPGWLIYTVRRGDTLTRLALRAGTTTAVLMRGNCLGSTALIAGSHLYVPPAFYASPTPEPYLCGPPLHWVIYIVQPGDTLYSLSRRFNVGLETLRRNNCLRSYAIDAGQALYVPPLPPTPWPSPTPWPTFTPSPTPTPSVTPAPTATPTPSPVVPTATFTPVPSPTPTPLPTTTPPSPTPSPMPTSTSAPSSTPVIPSPSPTFTPMPTSTPTPALPSPTSTPTWTPPPTQTPLPTETPTLSPTATYTPTATPTLYTRSSS